MFHSHFSKEPADFSQERYTHTDDPSYQVPQSDDSDFGGRKKFSIFRPRLSKPNLLISICINTLRLFALVIVLCGLALAGAVVGIAKGYMETAPRWTWPFWSDQDKTSFLYDAQGNVITDYKGTENRVMVNISADAGKSAQRLCGRGGRALLYPQRHRHQAHHRFLRPELRLPARSRAAPPSPSS